MTSWWRCRSLQDTAVVRLYDGVDIHQAAAANFGGTGVAVENLVEGGLGSAFAQNGETCVQQVFWLTVDWTRSRSEQDQII